jgi:hypothetical protein
MKRLQNVLRKFNDIQIYSALIWALTIIISGIIIDNSNLSILLITAAGFHVVLMSTLNSKRKIKFQ